MRYTFFNSGSYFIFHAKAKIFPNTDKEISMLDYHKDLVRMYNSPDCYILDNYGKHVVVK